MGVGVTLGNLDRKRVTATLRGVLGSDIEKDSSMSVRAGKEGYTARLD